MSYYQFDFNSTRCRPDRVSFAPPLGTDTRFCFKNAAELPRVYRDMLIFVFQDGQVRALDKNSDTVWTTQIPMNREMLLFDTGVIFMQNDLALMLDENVMHVLNPATGELLETQSYPSFSILHASMHNNQLLSIQIVDAGKTLSDLNLICYDYKEKRTRWSHAIEAGTKYKNTASCDGTVLYHDKDGSLCCRDIATGNELWRCDLVALVTKHSGTYDDIRGAGRIHIFEGTVVQPIYTHHIAGIDFKTGAPKWVRKIAIPMTHTAVPYPDGTLYEFDGQYLIALRIRDGTVLTHLNYEKKMRKEGIGIANEMAVSDTHLYATDNASGLILAINRKSGEVEWRHDLRCAVPLAEHVAIIGEHLFVLDMDSNLHAFRMAR